MLTLGKRMGGAVRLAEVIQVLVRNGFADLVQRIGLQENIPARLLRGMRLIETPSGEPETLGHRLRTVLTELGPTFVKFGQILSTRPDVAGNAISQELRLLQDQVTAAPFDEIERVLVNELGETAAELFAEFDPAPVAAASLSQVYRARLKSGEAVAVKIQRPGIESIIESDLNLMRWLAEWIADHLEESAWIDPVGVVDEFVRSLHRELDFTIERRVIERVRHHFEGVQAIFVPKTYPEVSSERVLTMDWVDGVRVDALDEYPGRNCTPEAIAAIVCTILCQQVFEHHLFHADPHPGNIFITRDNQIAFLDYGMVGHLEHTDAAGLADLLRAVFQEDTQACVETLLLLTHSAEPEDRQAFEHEIADFIAFEGQAILGGGRVGDGIERMVDVLRHNHLQLAPRFSLLLKALATVESVGRLLDPGMDMIPIIRPHVERFLAARYTPDHLMKEAHQEFIALHKLFRQLPGDLQQLLRKLRHGQLKIQLAHEHLERLTTVVDRASNRVAFGVITAGLIIGSSMLMASGSNAAYLGLAGYIVAGVLGLGLIFSILRSRNY